MAKDKKKKAGKAKDPGAKLAREIGKQAERFVELAKHPLVSDIIAAGLTALAASVREGGKTKGAGAKTAENGAREDFTKTAQGLAGALAAKAAERVTSRLFDSSPSPAAPSEPQAPAAPATTKTAARRGRPAGSTNSKSTTRRTAAKKPDGAATDAPIAESTSKTDGSATPAPAKRAATKTPRATTRKPAAKTSTRKPRTPKTTS